MGSMFGGDSPKAKVVNPVTHLEPWQVAYYQGEAEKLTRLQETGGPIADYLSANPAALSDLTDTEQYAVQDYLDTVYAGQQVGDYAMQNAAGTGNRARDIVGFEAGLMPYTGEDMDATYARFENPYTEDVINATTAQIEREASRAKATRGASEASIGGLTSTRSAVADALAQQLTGDTTARLGAELRSKGFSEARQLGLAESDYLSELGLNRAELGMQAEALGLQESELLDRLATSSVGRQGSATGMVQGQEAARRQIADTNRESQRTAARDAASWYGGLFATKGISAPNPQAGFSGGGGGSDTAGQAMGAIASVAGAAMMVMSDEEAKEHIALVGESGLEALSQLPVYDYNYREGLGHTAERTRGLMAQDVETVIPSAVHEDPATGLKMVDSYSVLATVVRAVQELDERTKPVA